MKDDETIIPFEEEYPEEAKTLMDICKQRQAYVFKRHPMVLDAVEPTETIKRTMPKIGRNEKCPCGSEKKYKHCCGK